MRKIIIETIPHDDQRYETVGDYFQDKDGNVIIKVSDLNREDYEFLVALHEMVEEYLCRRAEIPEEKITSFDKEYEAARGEDDTSEPGDDFSAPYYHQHQAATVIERMMALFLGVLWQTYELRCANMKQGSKPFTDEAH